MAIKSMFKFDLNVVSQSISVYNLKMMLSDTMIQILFDKDIAIVIGKNDIKRTKDFIILELNNCLGLSEELDAITKNVIIKIKTLFKL